MKRFLKQLVIPALTSRPITAIANRLFDCGVPIFMLHRIAQQDEPDTGKISPAHLRNCLDYLSDQGYTLASLEELVLALKHHQKLPPKSVIFTMDDGYADQAEITSPIFLEYNCPLTFFIITGMLDQDIWPWDAKVAWIIESSTQSSLESCTTAKDLNLKLDSNISKRAIRQSFQGALKKTDAEFIPDILQRLADDAGVTVPDNPPPSYQPITWDTARQLEEQGIRFAPHSVNHNILSRLSQASMEKEVQNTWQRIDNELKNPLKIFCYPNGESTDFGEREIDVLKNSGYLGAVSTTPGFARYKNNSADHVFSLPRMALPDNMPDFIQYCSWIESAKESLF